MYKHIFFDLDHTLWDFEKNSSETLAELYERHQMQERDNFSKEDFITTFHKVNRNLWSQYNVGLLHRNELRAERFKQVFRHLEARYPFKTDQIAEEYISLCPTKTNLFPFTLDVLNYLKQHYVLHIITNGFAEVQAIKLSNANLSQYFSEIVTSEASGFIKPNKGMFDFALHKIKAFCKDCIMIGDDLEADILGAKNASIDHVYFNPTRIKHFEVVTHEIQCLSQLRGIL